MDKWAINIFIIIVVIIENCPILELVIVIGIIRALVDSSSGVSDQQSMGLSSRCDTCGPL